MIKISPLTILIFSPGLQTQSNTNPLYNGPWDAIKNIYGQQGIAGIYKGQAVTFLREATGYGVYFLTYEKLVQWEMAKKGIRRDQISPANAVIYGAASGYAVSSFHFLPLFPRDYSVSKLWAVIYPIDMIKSRMQTDGFTPATGQKYTSTLDCVRTVWRTEGIGAFTRGLGPTLIRYVSSIILSYEPHRNNLFLVHPLLTVRHSLDLRWRCAFWINFEMLKRPRHLIYLEF